MKGWTKEYPGIGLMSFGPAAVAAPFILLHVQRIRFLGSPK